MRRAGTAIFWGLLWASGLAAAPLSFQRDIRPLFAEKCVVCHACYDAPCQLKLGSAEGLERGASKLRVYDTRADAQAPTRLFFDGHGPADWQRRGFFPVSAATRQAALISRMLALGRAAPLVPYARLPETLDIRVTRDNQCPAPDEFERYANKFPHAGMPFAVTGLEPEEYQRLEQWLQQGAPVEPDALQPGPGEQQQIRQWEDFLNGQSLRQQRHFKRAGGCKHIAFSHGNAVLAQPCNGAIAQATCHRLIKPADNQRQTGCGGKGLEVRQSNGGTCTHKSYYPFESLRLES